MRYGSGKYLYELDENWAKVPAELIFHNAYSVAIDSQDNVYVINSNPHQVIIFDKTGKVVNSWVSEHLKRSHGICTGMDGTIFCTDIGNHTVSKFTLEGKQLMTMGNPGKPSDTGYVQKDSLATSMLTITKGGPPFHSPTGVGVAKSGEIFVADGYGNARVHKFNPQGKLLLSWGEPGKKPGDFMIPHSVRIDKENRVWVIDRENSRIQVFDTNGKFLFQWMDLIIPTDLCFDNEGTVYVSEFGLRVSIFSPKGQLLARWGSEGKDKQKDLFVAPHGIAIDSKNNLYVTEVGMNLGKVERGAHTIRRFVRVNQ